MEKMELVKYAQLDLLIELDRICRKNNINYFLVGGTLIGAIRHNGFIPWDDDIDVGMLRKDYDKFKEVCNKSLGKEYAMYDWHTDPASPNPFLKLKIKGTHYKENVARNSNMDDAVFIDVFPYDAAPNSRVKQKLQELTLYVVRKIIFLRCGFDIADIGKAKSIKKIIYFIIRKWSMVRTVDSWKKYNEQIQTKYNNAQTKYVVSLCGAYAYKKEMKRRAMLEQLTTHKFEGFDFFIPKQYDSFLREVYGDYMKLPPESKRVGKHKINIVDLGDYKIHCKEDIDR